MHETRFPHLHIKTSFKQQMYPNTSLLGIPETSWQDNKKQKNIMGKLSFLAADQSKHPSCTSSNVGADHAWSRKDCDSHDCKRRWASSPPSLQRHNAHVPIHSCKYCLVFFIFGSPAARQPTTTSDISETNWKLDLKDQIQGVSGWESCAQT